MKPEYRILSEMVLSSGDSFIDEFSNHVLLGLSQSPKHLSSRYFYDDEGSALFQEIMALDEYYPTRIETEILHAHASELLADIQHKPINIVDLGAGDATKTIILLRAFSDQGIPFTYVPIDISEAAIQSSIQAVRESIPGLSIEGIVGEYQQAIRWLNTLDTEKQNLVLFLGSNIGNFHRAEAHAFMRGLWNALEHGDQLFVGFDLKKDIEVLLNAYNDRKGVTARFNLNLLARINRQLGGNFDLNRFRHYGTYNVFSGAMESYLVSLDEQEVRIEALQHSFSFSPWEPIHTEYSYKYLPNDIRSLAEKNGFVVQKKFYDSKEWFVDTLWRVEKK